MAKGKRSLVCVKWDDSATDPRWTTQRAMTVTVCESVGWIVSRNAKRLVIAASRNDAGQVGERTVIPNSVVRKVRKLR